MVAKQNTWAVINPASAAQTIVEKMSIYKITKDKLPKDELELQIIMNSTESQR